MDKKIDLKNMDKSNWQSFRFDEIASKISESVDPNNTDLEIYIGLEHLDSESLHIKRFGTPDDVNGTKLRFYPEDMIFGRRRAYQRKGSIATFDGFCSAHALVLRANPQVIDPKLFPFFIHSDAFMNRAIDISVGSLSPTINWGTLKHQEFLLPPKEQQARLAELLWAADEVVKMENHMLEVLTKTRQSFFIKVLKKKKGTYTPLSKILIKKKSKSQPPHEEPKYIGLEHIEPGAFKCNTFDNSKEVKAACNLIEKGNLCYSKLRPYLDKAFIADFKAVSSTEILVYSTKLVSPEYVLFHLHSFPFLNYISAKGFGTKMPRVNHSIIGEYSIKILEEGEDQFLKQMNSFIKNEDELRNKISNSKALQKSLINQIF